MDKSKIIAFFDKIRNFNFLEVLLTRKQKKLFNEVILNEELINFYELRIKGAKKVIVILETKIKNTELDNKNLRKRAFNIGVIVKD